MKKTIYEPKKLLLFIAIVALGATILLIVFFFSNSENIAREFNGDRAVQLVQKQLEFGPRIPGSTSHLQTVQWLQQELVQNGWDVSVQEAEIMGKTVKNIVAIRQGTGPWIILGAHYDTRILADNDPDPALRAQPVSGANDGASGVAVLLELSRVLPKDLNPTVWLVFFDAEDNGRIEGWDWILGSQAFVQKLEEKPNAVVIVDMIGDKDLNIYKEKNSHPILVEEIWDQARELGYEEYFINAYKYAILDDHTPFLRSGIMAIDIIDFDYPYYHTTQDTVDKVSAQSLEVVGRTLFHWILRQQ